MQIQRKREAKGINYRGKRDLQKRPMRQFQCFKKGLCDSFRERGLQTRLSTKETCATVSGKRPKKEIFRKRDLQKRPVRQFPCSLRTKQRADRVVRALSETSCDMRRRIHACHMRRKIHAWNPKTSFHMRRIHACHMRRRIHAWNPRTSLHMRRRIHASHVRRRIHAWNPRTSWSWWQSRPEVCTSVKRDL